MLAILWSKNAHARNDYLQGSFQQCNKGNFSIESSYDERDNSYSNLYPNSINSNNNHYGDGSSQRIGVRWTWYLGSNCTDYTQSLIQENMELAQQLELIKMCKRYNNKKLPPQFATLARKCEGVNGEEMIDDRPPKGKSYYDELMEDIVANPNKVPAKDKYYNKTDESLRLNIKGDKNTQLGKKLVIPDFERPEDNMGIPLPYPIPEIQEVIIKEN
tara:strand:- start:107 stop:754 length:648 start_codon:yes stop_codon:yes gene_type:complete